jgi:hypothetical protein
MTNYLLKQDKRIITYTGPKVKPGEPKAQELSDNKRKQAGAYRKLLHPLYVYQPATPISVFPQEHLNELRC